MVKIFSGNSNLPLARSIAASVGFLNQVNGKLGDIVSELREWAE